MICSKITPRSRCAAPRIGKYQLTTLDFMGFVAMALTGGLQQWFSLLQYLAGNAGRGLAHSALAFAGVVGSFAFAGAVFKATYNAESAYWVAFKLSWRPLGSWNWGLVQAEGGTWELFKMFARANPFSFKGTILGFQIQPRIPTDTWTRVEIRQGYGNFLRLIQDHYNVRPFAPRIPFFTNAEVESRLQQFHL